MIPLFTPIEARVFGSLIEKEITTPDYYPLSLNALMNATNQKSNRDPVMDLDEDTVLQALRSLHQKGYTRNADNWDSRVAKYKHRLQEVFNLTRPETALLCMLLLRGAQTAGELRSRTERMHRFDDLTEVHSALSRLMKHDTPLASLVPRKPGTKEDRYIQLLSESVRDHDSADSPREETQAARTSENARIATLENQVAELKKEVADLKEQLLSFRKQFE